MTSPVSEEMFKKWESTNWLNNSKEDDLIGKDLSPLFLNSTFSLQHIFQCFDSVAYIPDKIQYHIDYI